MGDELDDTVMAVPREALPPTGPDLEDTVVRSPVAPPRERRPVRRQSVPPVPVATRPRRSPTDTNTETGIRIGADGQIISLDVPCYIGRRPRRPRIATGVTPRLVSVPSARGEVSSTHLELRREGSAVVATDLRSTNGTVVRLPGHVSRTLRPGESIVVVPGTALDLGDDIVVYVVGPGTTMPGVTDRSMP